MTEVPLRVVSRPELGTRPCKIEGCTAIAASSRGYYALLCERHRHEKKMARQRDDREARRGLSTGRYESKTQALLPLARRLDRALHEYEGPRDELKSALEDWLRAIAALTPSA